MVVNLFLTLVCGFLGGYFLSKIKFPGGMMIGSLVGAATFNIIFKSGYMPIHSRVVSQIIAGTYIGTTIKNEDLKRFKSIYKQIIVLIIGMLVTNLISGFLVYKTSNLDLVTSLMSTVPGGISDMPIISAEMGADASKVAVLQFIRFIFGIGVFPIIIIKILKLKYINEPKNEKIISMTSLSDIKKDLDIVFVKTILVGIVFGTIGYLSKIPSATMVFSMISILILKFKTNSANMPRKIRIFAQLLAGSYIGSSVTKNDISEIFGLFIPSVILIVSYFLACMLIGKVINKKFNIPLIQAMLSSTPAGGSDMVLIAADLGIEGTDIAFLQTIRFIIVIAIFPQIMGFIVSLFT